MSLNQTCHLLLALNPLTLMLRPRERT